MRNYFLILMLTGVLFSCKDKKASLDADKQVMIADSPLLYKSSISTDVAKPVAATPKKTSAAKNNSNTTAGNQTSVPASTPTPVNDQDKGWSKAAKGATIGGAGGAVVGAVVSKNKAAGAIVGAVVGAGTGYAIGRSKDKKSGRVARKKAAKAAANIP